MANTGYKQAQVVYKVRAFDNKPVDINGELISVSGLKQAIALLNGAANPDANKYVVQFFYNPEATIDGVPTVKLSKDCPVGYIFLSPAQLVFLPGTPPQTAVVTSSANWTLAGLAGGIATVAPSTGPRGENTITVTRTATTGEADLVFKNILTGDTAVLHIVNAPSDTWVLQTGTWNSLGFWHDNGIFTN